MNASDKDPSAEDAAAIEQALAALARIMASALAEADTTPVDLAAERKDGEPDELPAGEKHMSEGHPGTNE